jgi:hypothetical protein
MSTPTFRIESDGKAFRIARKFEGAPAKPGKPSAWWSLKPDDPLVPKEPDKWQHINSHGDTAGWTTCAIQYTGSWYQITNIGGDIKAMPTEIDPPVDTFPTRAKAEAAIRRLFGTNAIIESAPWRHV